MKKLVQERFKGYEKFAEDSLRGTKFSQNKIRGMKFFTKKIRGRKKWVVGKKCSGWVQKYHHFYKYVVPSKPF